MLGSIGIGVSLRFSARSLARCRAFQNETLYGRLALPWIGFHTPPRSSFVKVSNHDPTSAALGRYISVYAPIRSCGEKKQSFPVNGYFSTSSSVLTRPFIGAKLRPMKFTFLAILTVLLAIPASADTITVLQGTVVATSPDPVPFSPSPVTFTVTVSWDTTTEELLSESVSTSGPYPVVLANDFVTGLGPYGPAPTEPSSAIVPSSIDAFFIPSQGFQVDIYDAYWTGYYGTVAPTDDGEPLTPVPEASSFEMLLMGIGVLGFLRAEARRKCPRQSQV
jgi:hypothetical protein